MLFRKLFHLLRRAAGGIPLPKQVWRDIQLTSLRDEFELNVSVIRKLNASGMKTCAFATSSPPPTTSCKLDQNNRHQIFTVFNVTFHSHLYNSNATDMSGRVLFARIVPLARRRLYNTRPVTRRSPY